MKLPSISRTVKNTRRLADILRVLSRFGFNQLIVDSGLYRIGGKSKEELGKETESANQSRPRAERVRLVLEELGPSFIKLGQILSTRPDLIPQEWADEFRKLQDSCSRVPYTEIEKILLQEFPSGLDQLFSSIDEEPLAAASIAQVHAARLVDGTEVVIKVLRPGVRELLEEDISLVSSLAQLLEQYFSNLGYSPTAVVKEFSREALKELNMVIEGQSADRMRHDFESDPNIHFPKIYWQATSRSVLTMERIKGRLLSALLDSKELTVDQRRRIVSIGTDMVFQQCLRFGFFHADPHPGNIFLRDDDSLCLIDCGMAGQLDRGTTEQLINLVTGVIKNDEEMLCRVILALTNVDPTLLDSREFRMELRNIASTFQNTDLRHLNITDLLSRFFRMLQRYRIECPSDLMLLTKALTTIEGVAEQLDPEFDVLAHVEPQIRELLINRYSLKSLQKRIMGVLTHSFELMEALPRDLQRFLDQARHSRFTLNLEMKRVEHLANRVESASRLMGFAMIISALIVGSSILILADKIGKSSGVIGTLGVLGLIVAGIATTGFFISFLLPKKNGRNRD